MVCVTQDDVVESVAEPEAEKLAAASDSNDSDLPLKPKKVRLYF